MATGVVNSQALKTPAGTPAVLRSGERQASTAEALKNPNSKTYFHRIAGAKFIMPDGLELQFLGGRFVTDTPEIISELDKVANKISSMIFTEQASIASATAQDAAIAKEASDTAGTLTAGA